MEQFNVVRVQPVRQAYAASGEIERVRLEVVSIVSTHPDFSGALEYREKLNELMEQLKILGVQFSAQYQMEIQQVVTNRGGLGGTRTRIIDLSDHDTAEGVDDLFFGESVKELVERSLREQRTLAIERELGIGTENRYSYNMNVSSVPDDPTPMSKDRITEAPGFHEMPAEAPGKREGPSDA
jgi:hypothetical protein